MPAAQIRLQPGIEFKLPQGDLTLLVGCLSAALISRAQSLPQAAGAIMLHEALETGCFKFPSQQRFNERDINPEPVGNAGWPDAIRMKLCNQFNLALYWQIAETTVAIGWAGGTGIVNAHDRLIASFHKSPNRKVTMRVR